MAKYIFKRTLQSLLSVFIVVFVVFLLLRLMPTDGYFTRDDYQNMSEAEREMYLKDIGAVGNPIKLFGKFMVDLFHGDLGESYVLQPHRAISDILAEKIPYSLYFGVVSMLISLVLGLLMGMAMAKGKGGLPDALGTGYVVIVRAVPSLIYLFLLQIAITGLFKIPMMFSERNPVTWILPTISLSLSSIAWYAIWLRRFMVDEENRDYVKFARSKGMSDWKLMKSHVLRNALVPLAQYFPLQMLLTISGSLVIESLYSIPGMGGLLVEAIQEMDNSLVQVLVILYSTLGVLGVFLGDILMVFLDPRIRLTEKEEG